MREKEQVLTMRKVTERKAVYKRLYIQAHGDARGTDTLSTSKTYYSGNPVVSIDQRKCVKRGLETEPAESSHPA